MQAEALYLPDLFLDSNHSPRTEPEVDTTETPFDPCPWRTASNLLASFMDVLLSSYPRIRLSL